MTKEKLQNLERYKQKMTDKLADKTVPAKHTNNPETYRAFLKNEIRMVTLTIEAAKG